MPKSEIERVSQNWRKREFVRSGDRKRSSKLEIEREFVELEIEKVRQNWR